MPELNPGDSQRFRSIKARPKDLNSVAQDDACLDSDQPKESTMDPHSLKQRLVLFTLATLASISTFTVFVLAPMAASGGMA